MHGVIKVANYASTNIGYSERNSKLAFTYDLKFEYHEFPVMQYTFGMHV